MGFFSRLKGQVIYQQHLELVSLEACQINRELNPKTLKNCVRLCVRRGRELDFFSQSLPPDYRDSAYWDFVALFKTLFDEALQEENVKDASEIYSYLDAILSVAPTPILKLSQETISTANEIRVEVGQQLVEAQWQRLTGNS